MMALAMSQTSALEIDFESEMLMEHMKGLPVKEYAYILDICS